MSIFLSSVQQNTKAISKNRAEKLGEISACGGLDLSTFLSSVQQNTKAISKNRAEKLEKISACGGLDLSTFMSSVQQNTKAISKNRAQKVWLKLSPPQAENFQILNPHFYDLGELTFSWGN